jgi:hypothetical protein
VSEVYFKVIQGDSEFLQFAMNSYDNPHLTTIDEFEADLKRFQYINNLFKRFIENEDLKDRLIINHIVILGNCFTIPGSISMLFYKTPIKYRSVLDTFLYYMGLIEKTDYGVNFTLLNKLETL